MKCVDGGGGSCWFVVQCSFGNAALLLFLASVFVVCDH